MTGTDDRRAVHRLRLHVLTDRGLSVGRSEREVATAALMGGATVIQLRCKDLTVNEVVATAHDLRALTRAYGALLIVNDHVEAAVAVDADGAHVGQGDMPAAIARRLLGQERVLGVSAGTVEEAERAAHDGADYIGFGPVFATTSKGDAGAARGLEQLRRVCRAVAIPVVAIGGITPRAVDRVIDAGAAGIAVISAVVGAPDIMAATRTLRRAMHDTDGTATAEIRAPRPR